MRSALRRALHFAKQELPEGLWPAGASESGSHYPKAGQGSLLQDRGFWVTVKHLSSKIKNSDGKSKSN